MAMTQRVAQWNKSCAIAERTSIRKNGYTNKQTKDFLLRK
jgi:hypothetical protein